MTEPTTTNPAPAKPLIWLFVAMLLVTLCITSRGWQGSILDRHEFRQTQTAISAFWIKAAGTKLAYETPLFGPPWSIPLEFPTYQWLVAKVSTALGTGLESTARGVSLFFFFATLPAIYGLAGLLRLAPSRRLLVLSVVLASPTYLFWARTFMMETTALCFSTWFLYAVILAVRDRRVSWAAGATTFGILAALTKITTFLLFCPPAAVICYWYWRRQKTPPLTSRAIWRPLALLGTPILTSVILADVWVRYSDHIKRANPFSAPLTSSRLTAFTWGTLEQRLSAPFWAGIWDNLSGLILGEAAMAILLIGFALASRAHRLVTLLCLACFASGWMLFSNLYYSHDYYYCANTLFLLVAAGLLLVSVWDNTRLPQAVRVLMLGIFFASQLLVYQRQFARYTHGGAQRPPEIATVIRDVVPPDGVVLIYGWDWNSLVPYYAERRALMVPLGFENDQPALEKILAQLPPRRIAGLLVRQGQPSHFTAEFIRERLQRFNLAPTPVATSNDGDLYLPPDQLASAQAHLARIHSSLASAASQLPPDHYHAALKPAASSLTDLPIFTPRPSQARTLYGMSTGKIGDHIVLNAHAPSELSFVVPAGATRVDAVVGLPEGAYVNPSPTDGVDVIIFQRVADSGLRVLFQRNLDPLNRPADRGPQKITFDLDKSISGPLIFGIYPGPANNVTSDWSYWQSITIH
ncbi:MAG: hypothetical protein ABI222_18295 [Opitutaceae bacterium]